MLILKPRVQMVDQIAFGPDCRLYSAGAFHVGDRYIRDNRGIEVWEVPKNSSPVAMLFPNQRINGFVLNPAGRWLYVSADSDRDVRISDEQSSGYFALDLSDGQPAWLGLYAWSAFKLAVHASGEWFIGYGCGRNWTQTQLIRWQQLPNGVAIRDWEKNPYPDVDFSCTGIVCDSSRQSVLALEQHNQHGMNWRSEIVRRDPVDWGIKERVPVTGVLIERLMIAPDGLALVACHVSSLLVWDAQNVMRGPRKIRGGKQHFTGIAFHPSGRYLAATSNDQTVKLYDTTTWELAKTFTWDIGRMRSIAFSPDGMLAAAGSDSGKVVVWDVDL